jgi:hypothetical protein
MGAGRRGRPARSAVDSNAMNLLGVVGLLAPIGLLVGAHLFLKWRSRR